MVDVSQTVAAFGTAGSLETVACCCSAFGMAGSLGWVGEIGTAVAFGTVAAAAFENLEKQQTY